MLKICILMLALVAIMSGLCEVSFGFRDLTALGNQRGSCPDHLTTTILLIVTTTMCIIWVHHYTGVILGNVKQKAIKEPFNLWEAYAVVPVNGKHPTCMKMSFI